MSFISHQRGTVTTLVSVGLLTLATGCGQSQNSSGKTSSQRPHSPREEALAIYLSVQKSIADGNFDQFKLYLAPEFTAAANSGALTPEFQRLTFRYGGSLATFFSGNAEFLLGDEEGRTIRIVEIFQYKTGLVQKWPNKELLAHVDEICAIGDEIAAHGFNSSVIEERIKKLGAKFKGEMVALAVKEGEDPSTVEKQWDEMQPDRLLEAISHYLQDCCELSLDGKDTSRPQCPKYRIDIGRWFPDMDMNPRDNNVKLSFRFGGEDGDVGPDFILQKFDDGKWKVVLGR